MVTLKSNAKRGNLFYDVTADRYDIRFDLYSFYGGLHCGDSFDVLNDDTWVPVQLEKGEEWYLEGLPGIRPDGLTVRI